MQKSIGNLSSEFHRQFVLSSTSNVQRFLHNRKEKEFWRFESFGSDLGIAIESNLRSCIFISDEMLLALIGEAFDPIYPEVRHLELLSALPRDAGLTGLIAATESWSGRWVLVCRMASQTYVLHDPCGLRRVFYYHCGEEFFVGSSSRIIAACTPLRRVADKTLDDFLASRQHATMEYTFFGQDSEFEHLIRVLPNHVLDCERGSAIRYFPCVPLPQHGTAEAVEIAFPILSGTLRYLAGGGLASQLRQAMIPACCSPWPKST